MIKLRKHRKEIADLHSNKRFRFSLRNKVTAETNETGGYLVMKCNYNKTKVI